MRLNGRPIPGAWSVVQQKPDYSYIMLRLNPPGSNVDGYFSVTTVTGNPMLMGTVYGHGKIDNTAYGFMAGYKSTCGPAEGE